jgi:hypothetical protein
VAPFGRIGFKSLESFYEDHRHCRSGQWRQVLVQLKLLAITECVVKLPRG